jgi:monoamine oxidase
LWSGRLVVGLRAFSRVATFISCRPPQKATTSAHKTALVREPVRGYVRRLFKVRSQFMGRSDLFSRLQRVRSLAAVCESTAAPEDEISQSIGNAQRCAPARRRFVGSVAAGSLLAGWPWARALAAPSAPADVAIVGAGLAGLYAGYVLAGKKLTAQVYEADTRVGGRVASLRGVFPGQVVERGAELIDTTHVTLRNLAVGLGLTLEDYNKQPGEEFFFFDGVRYSEAQVVEEYRALVAAMGQDLQRLSNGPTADAYTAFDRQLDFTSLKDYLRNRGAGALISQVVDVAYTIEFGREIDRQSALSFLFFAKASRSSVFKPFGVFSDERFHVVEGNDRVATGLAGLLPAPVALGHRLLRVAKLADGRVKLVFDVGGKTVERVHAAVILTLPAPAMRQVQFDASVGLPAFKTDAIARYDYGTNSKLMVGFAGRPWYERLNCNGGSYSDLPNHQNTWETNPSAAQFGVRGVITDYSGGLRGARLDPARTAAEATAFLGDLEKVWPGTTALVARNRRGEPLAHLENWLRNPLFGGGYSNNAPGYFTTLEGQYAKPVGNVIFAGEHTDSFYEYQGFMEGALLSGARAANEAWRLLR